MSLRKSIPLVTLLAACALALLLPLAGSATPSFPDVAVSHPYYAAITDLAERGIILGFPNGTFGPGEPVSRQQFAKMVVLTLGLGVSEQDVCPFADVEVSGPGNLYPDNYVAVAAARGITKGLTPAMFAPYADISRFQVISMVMRAADDLYPGLLGAPPAGFTAVWDPAASPDHGQNARRAEYNGLLALLPLQTLDPWGPMPRGEVAQVLHNLLLKLTPPSTTTSGTTTTQSTTTTTQSTTTTTQSTTTTTIPSPPLQESDLLYFHEQMGGGSLHDPANRLWDGQDISIVTGRRIVSSAVSWVHETWVGGTVYSYDHLAAMAPNGDLFVFWQESLQEAWMVVNVSEITGGTKIAGPPAYWVTEGPQDHLAARAPNGDLLVFYWAPWHDWQVVNVTSITGQKVAGYLGAFTSWTGTAVLEHVAATSPYGGLLLFTYGGGQDWRVSNVSETTQKHGLAGPLSVHHDWSTWNVLATTNDQHVLIFRSPHTSAVQVEDLTSISGVAAAPSSSVSAWTINRGGVIGDCYAIRTPQNQLAVVTLAGGGVKVEMLTQTFLTFQSITGAPIGQWDHLSGGNSIYAIQPSGDLTQFHEAKVDEWWSQNLSAKFGPRVIDGMTFWQTGGGYKGERYTANNLAVRLKE